VKVVTADSNRSGRTEAWIKVKCWNRDRFVVVGFVLDGAGGLAAALAPLARSTSPLSKSIKKKDTTWVDPRYNAEIMYADITDDGMVWHPSFKRLVP
jgi:bifunctional non-homologous end joining protein LigD